VRLHGLVYYRGSSDAWTDDWQDDDYRARNLVKGLKGLPFGGHCSIGVGKTSYAIDNTPQGRANATMAAARAIAGKIQVAGYKKVAVIPVPSSKHTDPDGDFVGLKLARQIHELVAGFVATPLLYFKNEMPKSADGGTRNPWVIEKNLRRDKRLSLPNRAVLLDDVCTTGAHLKAAGRYLAKKGVVVEDAFVVGRTAQERPAQMFKVAMEEMSTQVGFMDPFG